MPSGLITFSASQGFLLEPPARAGGSFSSMPPTGRKQQDPRVEACVHTGPAPGHALATPRARCVPPHASPRLPPSPQLASERSTHPMIVARRGLGPPAPRDVPPVSLCPSFIPRPIEEQTCSFCSLQNTPHAGPSPGTPITAAPGRSHPSSRPLPALTSSPSASPPCAATPIFSQERQCCLCPCSNRQ